MQSSHSRIYARALMASVIASVPDFRHTRDTYYTSSTPRHVNPPFSSSRQHARAARLYMVTMPNGHTVMQIAPRKGNQQYMGLSIKLERA